MVTLQVISHSNRTLTDRLWWDILQNLSVDEIHFSMEFQLAQVASGLSHLHYHSIVHGDVKGVRIQVKSFVSFWCLPQSNVLIDDAGNARLTDFGLARILQTSGYTRTIASGTVRWMARELVTLSEEGERKSDQQVTVEADVWAFAMTVIEVGIQCSVLGRLTLIGLKGFHWLRPLLVHRKRYSRHFSRRRRWSSQALLAS